MRRGPVHTVELVLGVLLLVDVLRVWLPSIITIFGQAAATPAELLAAFALVWFLLAFGAPPLARIVGPAPVALTAAVVLAGCRTALPATPGGSAQLYTASFGLLAGLVWLAATATATPRPVPGLVLGLASATVVHTALGTYDLVWRSGAWTWTVTVVGALLFAAAVVHRYGSRRRAVPSSTAGGSRSWLLFGPALLLTGMISGSPALLHTGLSYGSGLGFGFGSALRDAAPGSAIALPDPSDAVLGGLFGTAAITGFVAGALLPAFRRWRWAGAALLLAGTLLFVAAGSGGLVPAILVTAAGLGASLGATDQPADTAIDPARSRVTVARRGFAAVTGMIVFALATVLHYAAYDLGYPNHWVPVTVAILVAVVSTPVRRPGPDAAARSAPAARVGPATTGSSRRWLVAAAALAAALAGIVAPRTGPPAVATVTGPVRLVAYNIRMGFGLDGRFDLDGLASAIAGQRPDVVALSEVDRGWLLNGGHDSLTLLARRLGLSYVFAPAADPVWGDAILTRMPVREVRSLALAAVGAPTGAQALAAVLDAGGREFVVVSTHLQPPPDDGPVVQARATARFATAFAAGRPLAVAGDLNTEPGEPAFEALRSAGLVDAFAAVRPLPTSPADQPEQEIDHVFVSPGVIATDAVAPPSRASDHLPVAVTLTLPTTR